MTVWYPRPRRFASFFAHASIWGWRRIDTGLYFVAPFGGRPRRGRLRPSLSSMAFCAAATSLAVTRRAVSNGNSLALGISRTLPTARPPRADESITVSWLPDREYDDEHSNVRSPISQVRSSLVVECFGSGARRAHGSSNAVIASSNETPCFRRLAAAFGSSHSNLTYGTYRN